MFNKWAELHPEILWLQLRNLDYATLKTNQQSITNALRNNNKHIIAAQFPGRVYHVGRY